MNYCISGKSGFIGQAIAKYLLTKGESVYGIPRLETISELVSYFVSDLVSVSFLVC